MVFATHVSNNVLALHFVDFSCISNFANIQAQSFLVGRWLEDNLPTGISTSKWRHPIKNSDSLQVNIGISSSKSQVPIPGGQVVWGQYTDSNVRTPNWNFEFQMSSVHFWGTGGLKAVHRQQFMCTNERKHHLYSIRNACALR